MKQMYGHLFLFLSACLLTVIQPTALSAFDNESPAQKSPSQLPASDSEDEIRFQAEVTKLVQKRAESIAALQNDITSRVSAFTIDKDNFDSHRYSRKQIFGGLLYLSLQIGFGGGIYLLLSPSDDPTVTAISSFAIGLIPALPTSILVTRSMFPELPDQILPMNKLKQKIEDLRQEVIDARQSDVLLFTHFFEKKVSDLDQMRTEWLEFDRTIGPSREFSPHEVALANLEKWQGLSQIAEAQKFLLESFHTAIEKRISSEHPFRMEEAKLRQACLKKLVDISEKPLLIE